MAKAIAPRARRKHVEYREEERPRSPLVMAKYVTALFHIVADLQMVACLHG